MKFKHPALLLFIAGVVHCANAHTYTFDASMLGDAAKGVDMSLFNQGTAARDLSSGRNGEW